MEDTNDFSVSNKDVNKDASNACVRCKQFIKVGLKCVRCGRLTHKGCAKLLKNATVLDSNRILCCGDLKTQDASTDVELIINDDGKHVSCDVLNMKIRYLEEIIKQKDLIIMNQGIALDALKDQIHLLKQQSHVPSSHASQPKAVNGKSTSKSASKLGDTVNLPGSACGPVTASSSTITLQDVSNAIQNVETRRICNDLINIESDKKQMLKDKYPRAKKRRSILVGSGVNLEACPFKAASLEKLKHFHATNFDVNVDEEELCRYLKAFAPNVIVKKLMSRNPGRYSSFKISVPLDEVGNIQVPEIWPNEVVLNHFFLSKRPIFGQKAGHE